MSLSINSSTAAYPQTVSAASTAKLADPGPAAAAATDGKSLSDAFSDAASAVVSFSSRAFDELSGAVQHIPDSIGSALHDTYEALGNAVDSVKDSAVGVVDDIASMTHDKLEDVRSATHTALEAVRHTASDVGDSLDATVAGAKNISTSIADSVTDAAGALANYAALGAAAAGTMLREIV